MSYDRRQFVRKTTAGLFLGLVTGHNAFSGGSVRIIPGAGMSGSEDYWELFRNFFPLMKGLRYFNNASLGPSPDFGIEKTDKYRRQLESFPSKFMWGAWTNDKEKVRQSVASYFSVDSSEIALIHNTTEAMNLFARSFDLREGDEIILADHEHRTGLVPYEYFCESRGVRLVRPELPLLPESPSELVEVYKKAISPRTKLISLVHMTNTNGMILPVKEISRIAHQSNILVCVDAAQSAGMLDINIRELGCDFLAASGHKWLWGPKGTGILYASSEKRELLKPLMISNRWKESNIRMFEDYNTRNLPEILGLGAAFEFNNSLGPKQKEERIYTLKRFFREKIADESKFILKTPADDTLSAGVQVVELKGMEAIAVAAELRQKYNIICRPMLTHGLNGLRISLSPFNTLPDIEYLIDSLRKIAG